MMEKHEATKGASVTIVPQWKPKTSIEKQFFEWTDLTKRPKKISEKYIVSIAIQTTTAYNLLNVFDSSKIIS